MSSSIPMNGPIGTNASPKPPVGKLAKVDAYAAMQIENLYLKVQNLAVRQFLETVLDHLDIRIVLATPIREDGQTRRLLVEAVQPVAEQLQMDAYDCTTQVDAVYVATILLAVDYWMYPFLMGKYDTPFALKRMVDPALLELQKADLKSADAIRACMSWTKHDEEPSWMDWLIGRVLRLMGFLKLADF